MAKKSKKQRGPTKYINLWKQPRTSVEALAIVRQGLSKAPADLTAETGTCEIKTDGKKIGEMSKLIIEDQRKVSWALPASFAQTDLCRVAYYFSQGNILLPGIGKVKNVEVVKLSDVATLGPDGRDVYDGFSLTKSITPYPAFWGYDAEELCGLKQESNQYLSPLPEPLPGRHLRDANLLWSRSGTLMLPKELRLTTSRMAAVVLPTAALSNVFWPTRWLSDDSRLRTIMERRLALWFNSTLGFFSMVMQRQETEGAWVKFPKAWYEQLQIIDLESLTRTQCDLLDELWNKVKDQTFLPIPQMSLDGTRKLIDDVFSRILGIPALDQLRTMLSKEPFISMQPL